MRCQVIVEVANDNGQMGDLGLKKIHGIIKNRLFKNLVPVLIHDGGATAQLVISASKAQPAQAKLQDKAMNDCTVNIYLCTVCCDITRAN